MTLFHVSIFLELILVYCVYTCTSACLQKYAPYVAFRKSSYFPNGMLFLVFMKAISDIINIVTNCLLFKSLLLSFIEFKSSNVIYIISLTNFFFSVKTRPNSNRFTCNVYQISRFIFCIQKALRKRIFSINMLMKSYGCQCCMSKKRYLGR